MDAILTVVLPVFALIAAGYLAGSRNLLGGGAADALNSFVYYFSLPALFFNALAQTPLGDVFRVPFALSFLGGAVVCAALSVAVARLVFHRSLAKLTMNGAAAVFANTGYMGIPILQIAFGERGVLAAVIGTVLTGVVMMALMIILLEAARAREAKVGGGVMVLAARTMAGLARSPLLVSAIAGIAWSALALPMPQVLGNFTALLAATAGPCALFAMGLFLVGKPVAGLREVAVVSALKLLLMPAVTAWLAFGVFQMDAWWAAAVTLLAALPTGSLVFVTAHRYHAYTTEAASIILCSTVLSVATLSGVLVWLGV